MTQQLFNRHSFPRGIDRDRNFNLRSACSALCSRRLEHFTNRRIPPQRPIRNQRRCQERSERLRA